MMINLLQAYLWFDEALQEAMKDQGSVVLNRTQSLVMSNVAAGEHRAARIAQHLGISRQAVNQVIKSLMDLDLLVTRPDPSDNRALLVEFTDESAARRVGIEMLKRVEAELMNRIGAEKAQGLRAALDADWGEPPYVGDHARDPE